ncbi:hypothetical protein BUALT_Bualt16G0111200 [Buddleja alternifolia]|uniref:NB-ARC domain-containing protein n=1 Tax=Buddleja alternifolia TaxID=168488 RepID=A0AAV6WLK9_9LAMI|nr:hypothetical protein BUALT_Bualt16G0111200 [Buddleja alternifolia]
MNFLRPIFNNDEWEEMDASIKKTKLLKSFTQKIEWELRPDLNRIPWTHSDLSFAIGRLLDYRLEPDYFEADITISIFLCDIQWIRSLDHFEDLPEMVIASLTKEIEELFMLPQQLFEKHKKNEVVAAFIDFLVQLLSHGMIELLKSNIIKFSNLPLSSSIIKTDIITPEAAAVDSFSIIVPLLRDLEELIMNRENDKIVNMKGQINLLHQGLKLSLSFLKDIKVLKLSDIEELKEVVMRIRDVAYESEYLINSFLVGYAHLWYLNIRIPNVIHKIKLIEIGIQEIEKKYDIGALKIAENFSSQISLYAKRNSDVEDVIVGLEDKTIDIRDRLTGGKKHLQIITIFGMLGLGKTTFAKKLYVHPTVNCYFDKLSWCIVSQAYQRKSVLIDILISLESELGRDKIFKMEEENLAEHIYKSLKGRSNYSIYGKHQHLYAPLCSVSLNPIYKASHLLLGRYGRHVRSFIGYLQMSPLNVVSMELLRVLDCWNTNSDDLVGIETLVHLRYLAIYTMPASIASFVNLEYLVVHYKVSISSSLLKLAKLRHLQALTATFDEDCNSTQVVINNLEYLSNVCIRNVKDEEMLKCSPHLRKLKCTISVNGMRSPSRVNISQSFNSWCCRNLKEIPCAMGEIETLQLIEVEWCQKSVGESATQIIEEQRDMGNEELRIIIGSILDDGR